CPVGQHAKRLGKIDPFVFLDEIKDIAAGAATPALVGLALRVQFERGCVVVVEWAQSLELGTGTVERQRLADQRDDVDRVLDRGKDGFRISGHRGLLNRRLRPGSMVVAAAGVRTPSCPHPEGPLTVPSLAPASREL